MTILCKCPKDSLSICENYILTLTISGHNHFRVNTVVTDMARKSTLTTHLVKMELHMDQISMKVFARCHFNSE